MIDDISDANPPNRLSSCKIIAFPVFLTEFMIDSESSGERVLKSIKSQLIKFDSITFID